MPPRRAAAKPELTLVLTALSGPLEGHTFSVQKSPAIVGRKRGAAVWIKDGFVSEQHAEFSYKDGEWYITELGSSNGTSINRQPFTEQDGPRKLQYADELQFGSESCVLVELDRDAAPARLVELADALKRGLEQRAAKDEVYSRVEGKLAALAKEHSFEVEEAWAAADKRDCKPAKAAA